jgi:hypothetical protein
LSKKVKPKQSQSANSRELDGETELITFRLTRSFHIFLLVAAVVGALFASLPAYAQHGTIGVDFGETTDHFGGQSSVTGAIGGIDGEVIVWKSPDRQHGADIVAGGEVRWPEDASNHASEQAIYGGFAFHFGEHLSAGIHVQIRRLVPPPSYASGLVTNGGVVFNRDHMELLETQGFVQYKFGPDNRAFARIEGAPEFSPRFHPSPNGAEPFLKPNFDHGYAIRGTVGYNFGRWYVKGTYQLRYLKFETNFNNPDDVYNWRNTFVTGGVGFNF